MWLPGELPNMSDDNSSLLDILKDFVPRDIYEELRTRHDELLVKMGRIQEQMLYLLDYRLAEEKENHEEHHLKDEIIDHIRNTLDFKTFREKRVETSRASAQLLEELRAKYEEIEKLKRHIEDLKTES